MEDPIRDLPNRMEFPLTNGNTLIATRRDPYGGWFLSLQKGTLPDEFSGGYTTRDEVRKAADLYSKYRDIPLGPAPERPTVKYKQIKNAPSPLAS